MIYIFCVWRAPSRETCCQGASNRFWVASEARLAGSGNKWFGFNSWLQGLLRQFCSNYRWVLNCVACWFNCCLGNSKGIIRGAGPEVSSFMAASWWRAELGCVTSRLRRHVRALHLCETPSCCRAFWSQLARLRMYFQVLKMDVAEKDLMQFLSEEVFIALTSLKM